MNRLTPVVKNLILLNAIVFLAFNVLQFLPVRDLALCFHSSCFQPYQLVTHMFAHANSSHIFMNMLGLFFFGPPLEAHLGPKKFFILYLFAGLGAFLLHYLVIYLSFKSTGDLSQMTIPVLGASGCLFGVLAGFGMKFPNARVMLIFPPIPMKAWVMVVGYAALELFSGLSGVTQGVAHFAHLGGAIFGALIIIYWNKFDKSRRWN